MTTPIDPRDDQARIPQQAAPPSQPATEPDASPPARSRRWWWIAAAVVVVLAAGGGVAYAVMPGDEDKAVEQCQQAISDQLKAPSTAEYGEPAVTSEDGNFGTYYEVTGVVDAENGFGATVRGDYRCKVNRESDGTWLVPEATFTQR
ncbi:hypothetical protein ABZ814_13575 [Micromonospora musae]|uniref:hypothetical protein n=1 Tax=Micromonospora musae TaxID=1894970 RepID=UPI0033E8C90C